MAKPDKNHPLRLWVEGNNDLHVIANIKQYYSFKPDFIIKEHGGVEQLSRTLRVELKPGNEIERLGIVVDADLDIAAHWASIRDSLIRVGYTNIPTVPDPLGTIVFNADLPRLGIWIIPDNILPGMIEDFVRLLIPPEDPLLEHAHRALDSI